MKNSITALVLISALVQGSAVIALNLSIIAIPETQADAPKLKGPYAPQLFCNGIRSKLPVGEHTPCVLQEGKQLSVFRGNTKNRVTHECTYTLRNEKLVKGYCSPHWHPEEYQHNVMVFEYSKHGH
jgi:hypothetical protein